MVKNLAHSLKVKLLNLSDHDNRRYQQLLVRYMQERFLYRLSESKYCSNFILKGGALLYAYNEFLPRPTLDVDFMGTYISNDKAAIVTAFKEIASTEVNDDGVKFLPESVDASDIAVERKYPGVRITVVGMLDTVRKELTFDIGFGDVITPSPVHMTYPTIIEEMENPRIIAYSLETVIAEKFQTMVEKSVFNSRMKDFFDLYRIIGSNSFDEDTLLDAIRATFENRHTAINAEEPVFSQAFAEDITLESRWNAYCKKIKFENAPKFQEIMAIITTFMGPYWNRLTQ